MPFRNMKKKLTEGNKYKKATELCNRYKISYKLLL